MNKFGHVTITKNLIRGMDLKRRHRFCLTFGSILPDILVYTYAGGHRRSSTQEMVFGKMKKLARSGRRDCLSFLRLGYILHYVEDYFTYPHNDWFTHGTKRHFSHECRLAICAWDHRRRPLPPDVCRPMPVSALPGYIVRLHGHYAAGRPCIARDYHYIRRAGAVLLISYLWDWENFPAA
ncbi:MAG: zinc dependent phospholipase C family protein [Blautia sp.]|nr:zinc dependent phospholipase C family protein [Blautia sp.]